MRNDYSEYLQKSRQVYYNRLLIIVAAFLILSINNLYAQCPANFNFNYNNLSYWTINLQLYNGATVPNTNVTTFNAPPASIQSLQSYLDQSGGQNAVQIFANTGSSQSTDPIAPTIKTVPNINGYQYDYAVKLGNTTTGRLVRKISYLINVPTGVTAYNVTYAYALVLQDPGHAWDAQPRFTATVRDPEKPAGQDTIKCASVSYFVPASAADKAAQGFFLTSSGAYAKDWSEASLDIAGWSGKTIIIEFESDDCSAGGHYGYAYFAIRNDGCGAGSVTGNSIICGNNGTYLYSTPPILGASYNWTLPSGWTGTSTTNAITVTPSSNGGYITVTPTKSCGSVQTRSLNVTVATSVPAAPGTISGPASICNNSSNLTYTVNRVSNASSYAWTIPPGWTIVNGGTDTTVTVNATTSGGSISVVAKNGCGSSNPSASTLSIINSPASVGGTTTGGTSVCAGTNVSLSSSGYTGTIQSWQNSTDGGLTWNDIAATSTSYTANNPTTSALYRIKVQNGSCPPAYSTPTTLSVNAPPAIMFNPTSVGACTGGTVNFSVTATGAGLSYQWQRSTDGNNWVNITGSGTPADGITYSNYTTNQLTLANVPIGANNYQYRCVVSGTCSPQAISTAATISISGASATISTQPTGITLCQGSTTTLSMSAVGSNLTYQWYTNTNNANTGGTAISGATQKDITFSASSSGTTYYYCVATSTCGANSVTAATNAVPVVVNTSNTVSVSFSANPGNTICANTPVTFTANPINGGTSPSFVWTKNNVVVGTSAATYIDSSLNNADVIGLTLNSNVSCAIGNPASAAPAIITVNPLPAVANITGPNTVQKGNTITLNNSTNGGTWSSSNNSIATVNSSGLVTGVAEGNVTITYTYNNGTCTNSSSLNITVTEVPPSALSYTTPNVYTVGSTISSLNPTYSGGIVTDFGISPALPAGLSFNSTTGVISGTPTAISAATNYTITATNSGGSTTAIVNITVNDVAPSGLSYTTPNVYTVGTAITPLTPSVSGGAVTSYSISGTLPAGLNFNTTTGVISGTPTAISAATNYTITATNSGGSTTAIVNITVNDVAPSGLSYTTPNVYTVGTAITPLTPSVSGGAVTGYSISGTLPAGLNFNTTTGVISGTPTAISAATNYTITATNSGGSTTAIVNITVNDVAPSGLSYTTPNVYTVGTAITPLTPSVSGGAVTSYSISGTLPAGLNFNTTTGVISGTPTAISAATNYTVTATNSGGSTTAIVNITVNDVAPSGLSYTTPNVYTVGTAITPLTPSVSGGAVTGYSISGTLPAGLNFNTITGVISGTPTAISAATNYTITATNSGGSTTFVISLAVNDIAPSGLSYTTPNVYTVGTAITPLTPSVSGGAVTGYSISGTLPAGLNFNSTTGVISGTPTAISAATNYTVTATNSGGSTTAIVNITVNDVAPSGLSYTTPNVYTVGTAITPLTPSVSGGAVAGYSISGTLPAGLNFNTTTGVISGTPTAISAATNYTITAMNSGGSITTTVNITVNDVAPSGLSYTTPNVYTVGTAITPLTPSVSGGAVTGYSISGTLPAGLNFNTTTGVISGTPTAISAATDYTISATNSGGSTTATVNITVVNSVVPTFVNVNNNNICVGQVIQYSTQSGYYNYSWNIPGTLNVDYKIVSGGIGSTDNQVTLQWLSSGNKTVSVNYADVNGFTGTLAAVVTNTVNGLPSGTIVAPQGTILCSGTNLPLSVSGGVSYAWQLNGVGISGGTNGQLSANTVGTYSVLITDANGCSNNAGNTVTLTGISAPVASYTVNSYCVNQPLQVSNTSQTTNSGMVSYTWSDNLGNTSSSSVPSFSYSQPGNVQLQLTVTPQLCPQLANSVTQSITIASPQAGLRMSPVNVIMGNNTTLNARQISGVINYSWVPSTGLSNGSVSNPTVNINQEQLYYINMTTSSGCVTTDTLLVRVFAGWDIFVPNVFSPNGDGVNDILNVNLVGVKSLHYFRIYNRWSKKVFETSNAGTGWDGKVNGVLQPMATYVWVAEGVDNNGNIVHKEGTVTLLR